MSKSFLTPEAKALVQEEKFGLVMMHLERAIDELVASSIRDILSNSEITKKIRNVLFAYLFTFSKFTSGSKYNYSDIENALRKETNKAIKIIDQWKEEGIRSDIYRSNNIQNRNFLTFQDKVSLYELRGTLNMMVIDSHKFLFMDELFRRRSDSLKVASTSFQCLIFVFLKHGGELSDIEDMHTYIKQVAKEIS